MHPLGPLVSLASTPIPAKARSTHPETATTSYIVPLEAPELPALDTLPAAVEAETYIYAGPLQDLSADLWLYEDFVRENAWKWVGDSAAEENYAEVDNRREMNGKTLRA